MKIPSLISCLIVLTVGGAISSCGSSTYIMKSWKKPGVTASDFNKVFVASITSDTSLRRSVESSIGEELERNGKVVTKSIDVFPENTEQPNKEIVFNAIQKYNPDVILSVALLAQETEPRYTSDRFPGYYGGLSSVVNTTGYYTNDKVYYLQTNLFDGKTSELVWAATSQSVNPKDLPRFMKSYKKAMKKQMKKDGFIE